MPTNLPPEYAKAEQRYRAAKTPREKIETLQEMISIIPKHKGTDKLRAGLRRRLSKLKDAAQTRKGTGRQESAFQIEAEGAGQAMVIGHANTGKSSLIVALTNADPEVSPAPFSTWRPTPGMMEVENVQIQLVDTPPLNRDFVEPELVDLLRRTDLMLLMVDLLADPLRQLEESLAFLEEQRIIPRHRQELYPEQRRLSFVPCLILVNKHDDESRDEDFEICCELMEEQCPMLSISAATGRNLDQLRQRVFEKLDLIRIYSKAPGEEPDLNSPFVLPRGSTVEEFALKLHQDFYYNLKRARVWGSASFDGQQVGRDHVLQEGDVVELRT